MPPKHQQLGVARGGAPRRGASNQGYFGAAYNAVTSKENRSVVQSIGIFTAAVAFFSSSWSEFILPPL